MSRRGLITPAERESMPLAVNIANPARGFMGFIPRPDTTRTISPADSLQFEPLNLLDLLNTGNGAPDAGINLKLPGGK